MEPRMYQKFRRMWGHLLGWSWVGYKQGSYTYNPC